MFNSSISIPISPLTNTYIGKLKRIQNDPDYSLICLVTALIKPRVDSFKGIDGYYKTNQLEIEIPEKIEYQNNTRNGLVIPYIANIPAFHYYICPRAENFENTKRKIREIGLTELTTIESFVWQQLNISNFCVFINEENNSAYIVASSISMPLYHLSISFISLLFPKLFKEKPLTKEETETLKGLTNKSPSNFINKISSILQYMKQDLMREELTECFRGFREAKINQCKADIDEANSNAEQYLEQYRRQIDRYNELIIYYEGLKAVNSENQNEEEKEIIDYVCTCPKIHNVNYANGKLEFCADTLLTNFDINKWRNAVRRNNIFDNYRIPEDSAFKFRNNREMLLNSIFSAKPLLYIKTKGQIQIWIQRCDMAAPRGQSEAEADISLKDCISNPHFKIHGCPGRNREQINRWLRSGDVVSAIECSIAAVGSVNIDETEYTFRPFIQEVLTSNNKILQDNQGNDMTPEEALIWLSKQAATPSK